ncbi:hypothetical protein [Rhizobium leguminosarum]|uniref:hypothetical protein n=1 Tax=Rhizobium leguminosarum TaxID=384 RepID=UPI001C96C2EC|nr:hypothetical protein [Rhizobium leguminosarum]MBY5709716.1 hypothetical protein [Rhizobium leguminosarum]
MLAAEALRLAAIEVLRPTAAVEAGTGFPTIAGVNVLDSREIAIEDIDTNKPYTPVLSLFTKESGAVLRGPMAAADDSEADAVIDIVAELAVVDRVDDNEFSAVMAATDPEARLVLAALCSQVRYLLEFSQAGILWRMISARTIRLEEQTFAVADLGIRLQRVTMRYHCQICDDDFDMDDGGLPQPIRRVYEALPAQSYAKAKLAALAAYFVAEELPPFEGGSAYGPET